MKKKIFIIGCTGIPACYGGFETFAENIALQLAGILDVSVLCSKKYYTPGNRASSWKSIHRVFINSNPNGFKSLFYDMHGLAIASKQSDYIVLLGVGSGLLLPFLRSLRSKPLFVHTDGIEWNRSKWNVLTRLFLKISYFSCLRYARTIILDNASLFKYVPDKYSEKVLLINYGGDHLPILSDNRSPVNYTYALVIARAEPENNLHTILNVFSKLDEKHIIIISNWQSTRYGKGLYRMFSGKNNIHLINAIYGNIKKLHKYRVNCNVYIHGHSAGGTNPSLVEAMYSGVPIIAWDNKFNRDTTNNLALFFDSEEKLAKLLLSLSDHELSQRAARLQNYAKQNYLWSLAARKLLRSLGTIEIKQSEF